jgi:hypothetical protein
MSSRLNGKFLDGARPMRSKVLAATLLIVCVAAAFVAAASAQSAPAVAAGDQRFHFIEKPGPDAVGLKVVEQYDFSRTYRPLTDEMGKPYLGERARPLQTLIWYPAQKSIVYETRPFRSLRGFERYGDVTPTETSVILAVRRRRYHE